MKEKYFAYMEVFLLKFNALIKLKQLTEFKIFLIKVHFVIYFGQIQQKKENLDLDLLLEVLDLVGVMISVKNLTTEIN